MTAQRQLFGGNVQMSLAPHSITLRGRGRLFGGPLTTKNPVANSTLSRTSRIGLLPHSTDDETVPRR
jgi:hypothetical protein